MMARKITMRDIERGRFGERLYEIMQEIARSARGHVVTIRAAQLAEDKRAAIYVAAALNAVARALGAERIKTSRGVRYVFRVEALREAPIELYLYAAKVAV